MYTSPHVLVLTLLLLLGATSPAVSVTDEQRVYEIVDQVDQLLRGDSSQGTITMQIVTGKLATQLDHCRSGPRAQKTRWSGLRNPGKKLERQPSKLAIIFGTIYRRSVGQSKFQLR